MTSQTNRMTTADAKVELVARAIDPEAWKHVDTLMGLAEVSDPESAAHMRAAAVEAADPSICAAGRAITALEAPHSMTEAIDALIEALEPFALLAGGDVNMNDPLSKWFRVGHLQAAREALDIAMQAARPIDRQELHPFEDGEDHNPDSFVHATPEQARIITEAVRRKLSEDTIKHMVDRFLGWKLPPDFNPDGGISIKQVFGQSWPTGTNLFNADQAEAMVSYMIAETPEPGPIASVQDDDAEDDRATLVEEIYDAMPTNASGESCYSLTAIRTILSVKDRVLSNRLGNQSVEEK